MTMHKYKKRKRKNRLRHEIRGKKIAPCGMMQHPLPNKDGGGGCNSQGCLAWDLNKDGGREHDLTNKNKDGGYLHDGNKDGGPQT